MLQSKGSSRIVEQAQKRADVLKSFAPNFDMGNGVSLEKMEALTEEVRLMIAEYNTAAATVERTGKLIREKEFQLAELGDRIVMGVGVQHGRQSKEFRLLNSIKRAIRKVRSSLSQVVNSGSTTLVNPIPNGNASANLTTVNPIANSN